MLTTQSNGHRGWINYLPVDPDFQRGGYGREIMEHAEQLLLNVGCPKINVSSSQNDVFISL